MLMRSIEYIELGATLFVPGIHKDLEDIVSGKKYPNVKSVLIDTEDGINQESLPNALEAIKTFLEKDLKLLPFVFIRPRDTDVLKKLLSEENISKIDGFILPKFSLDNAKEYLEILKDSKHYIMPSIEGRELFNQTQLLELKELLLKQKEKIILIRFGLEDMLKQLKMRRGCDDNIFDISATSTVVGNFIATFKSSGFCISGGVYPCFKDSDGFTKDVLRDLKEGLFSKTIIHPSQIELTNELYRVSQSEFDEALEICKSDDAMFSQTGKMAEVVTMSPWAQDIIKRAEVYGVY